MKKIALFPGSFDPVTKGHESVILRALPLFDQVVIAIGKNSNKKEFFTLEEKTKLIREVFKNESKVLIESYTGLTINFVKSRGIQYILRGLRSSGDFEFERTIAHMNRAMYPDVETIFMLTTPEFSAIQSTVVREVLIHGGDISPFVPDSIVEMIIEINKNRNNQTI